MRLVYLNLVSYLGAFALAVILTPRLIRVAKSLGLVDLPNVRKVHQAPIPRIGGIAIAIATIIPFFLALGLAPAHLSQPDGHPMRLATLVIAALSLMALGLADDMYNVAAKYKLFVLLATSTLFCASGGVVQSIIISGLHVVDFGALAWPVTILWLVGVTVSINFIDGLDGLAGGIVAIACGVLAVGSSVGGFPLPALLVLSLLGALSGFLIFNFYPAKIFMGDCGSMFIGFTLAASCVLANESIGSTRAMILPTLALSIPLLDTFFTMVRRSVLHRSSLFAAERGHVHHRLLDSGLWHPHVVLILHVVTLAAAVVGMISIFAGNWPTTIAAIAFGILLLGLFRTAGSVRARDTVNAIRRNREIGRETSRYQNAFNEMQLRFRGVAGFEDWWQQLVRCAELFDFLKINLPVTRRDGQKIVLRWRRGEGELAQADSITADIPIPQRRSDETLRVEVELAGAKFMETNGHRLSLFTKLMGEFGLDRLPASTSPKSPRISSSLSSTTGVQESEAADVGLTVAALSAGPFSALRVAIVHDFLYTYAGAERVLEQLINVFPHAELFSLFDFLPDDLRGFIRNKKVTTSFLQRMPFARTKHRLYLPLMPLAIEQLDLSEYDLIISSSYVAAKGVLTRSDQIHICYCHTPARYAWDMQKTYLAQSGLARGISSFFARGILHYIRNWDVRSANGVDEFITNSNYVGRRVEKLYRRQTTTIHPPVDTEYFQMRSEKEDYYVTASRMVPYKRIDLIVEAFSKMPSRRLIVVGDGPEMEKIKAKAGPNVRFMGHEPVDRLCRHMQLAKAFVFAADEDFGIAPVEAMACGTPVIAFNRGGVVESVIEGETGIFFQQQTTESLIDAVDRFEERTWSPALIRKQAEKFSAERFREQISAYMTRACVNFATIKSRKARLDSFDVAAETADGDSVEASTV